MVVQLPPPAVTAVTARSGEIWAGSVSVKVAVPVPPLAEFTMVSAYCSVAGPPTEMVPSKGPEVPSRTCLAIEKSVPTCNVAVAATVLVPAVVDKEPAGIVLVYPVNATVPDTASENEQLPPDVNPPGIIPPDWMTNTVDPALGAVTVRDAGLVATAPFEKHCALVTAEYTPKPDGNVSVMARVRKMGTLFGFRIVIVIVVVPGDDAT